MHDWTALMCTNHTILLQFWYIAEIVTYYDIGLVYIVLFQIFSYIHLKVIGCCIM
jgi:hypothetical protein